MSFDIKLGVAWLLLLEHILLLIKSLSFHDTVVLVLGCDDPIHLIHTHVEGIELWIHLVLQLGLSLLISLLSDLVANDLLANQLAAWTLLFVVRGTLILESHLLSQEELSCRLLKLSQLVLLLLLLLLL